MTPVQKRTIDFRYAPRQAWTCIGRPDDAYKSIVTQDGALVYGYDANLSFRRIIAFRLATDVMPLERRQWTETARVPIVHTTIRYPRATLELRAIGHRHDGDHRTDVIHWTVQAVDRTDRGATLASNEGLLTALWIEAREHGRKFLPATHLPGREIYAVDLDRLPDKPSVEPLVQSVEAQEVDPPGALAFASIPFELEVTRSYDFGPSSALRTPLTWLEPGQSARGAIAVPLNHEETAGFDLAWADGAVEDERRFWQGYDLQPLALELPDPDVTDMMTACARNILQAREVKDGLPEFQVGPAVYRGLWVVDGHFLLESARYLGHESASEQGIGALLRRVRPTGAIEQFPYHTKETGIALATLVRQHELTGDLDGLRQYWPIVQRAVEYIDRMREESKARGPDAPEYGLMPRSFGDGGLGGLRAEYTTTLWTLVGLKQIAWAADRLGFLEDAERFRTSFESLLGAFREHAEADMKTLPDGTRYLPMVKPGSGEHNIVADFAGEPQPWQRVNPGTATWALAHAIYPGEVFAPEDPIVAAFCRLLDTLDDEEEIPIETGWLPFRSVWSYSASFYAHVWLYAGRPDKAVDYLYGFANHAYPTRVWREEQSLHATHHGQIFGDMPHNWASAEFIRLCRNLLVMERGEGLELLVGLPAEWLRHDAPVRLEATPTRFGPVDLQVRSVADDEVEVEIHTGEDWPTRPQWCRVHVHRLGVVEAVEVDGRAATVDGGVLDIPVQGRVRIAVRMRSSRSRERSPVHAAEPS